MGIVNVTPDSFSDGGRFNTVHAGRDHALSLLDQGADWIDIGGESTRPGSDPVGLAEELERVLPVIEAIVAARPEALISIDTMKPEIAEAAVLAGATLWNDVNALRAPGALEMAARLNVPICLMHMQGEPKTMQVEPHYDEVVADVARYLGQRAGAAMTHGIAREQIILDPGIGFGKTLEHNFKLIKSLPIFTDLGFPILFGGSRKRFIHAVDAQAENAVDRLGGSIAVALEASKAGCSFVRVHDVAATRQALLVQAALSSA